MYDFPSIYRYARTRTRSTGAPHSAAELNYATTRLHPATGQQPPKPVILAPAGLEPGLIAADTRAQHLSC